MASGPWKRQREGQEYISGFLDEYKERMRPKIEAEIQELRDRLAKREQEYVAVYGEKFS